MTTDVDVVNRAASRIAARASLSSFDPANPPAYSAGPLAFNAGLNYVPLRKQLLRAAQWGFARKTTSLQLLGIWTNGDVEPPWLYKYAYPSDCLKVRYLINQWTAPGITPNHFVPLGGPGFGGCGWGMPSRKNRFLISYDTGGNVLTDAQGNPLLDAQGNQLLDPVIPQKVILSNVANAFGVYTLDVPQPDLWDSLFENAMVDGLASYLTMPLGGNVKLKQSFEQIAMRAVMEARAADGNEAIPTSDHTADWIQIRERQGFGFGDSGAFSFPEIGQWWGGYDDMGWGA